MKQLAHLFIFFMIIFPVQVVLCQDEPTHSIAELNSLLEKSSDKSERVALLLEASLIYVMRGGMEKNDFDSALYFVDKATNLSTSLNRLDLEGRCFRVYSQLYRENNETEKGRNYINQAIAISTRYDEKENLGDAYMELVRYYNTSSDSGMTAMIKYAERARQLYKESGKKLKLAETLKHLGDFYHEDQDSVALNCLKESLVIYQSMGYQRLQGVYDLMGVVYANLGDSRQGLKYALLAVETAESLKTDRHELMTIYGRASTVYSDLGQDQQANNYNLKAFPIALEYKDTVAACFIALNIMANNFHLGRHKEQIAFIEKNKFIYESPRLIIKTSYLSRYIQALLLVGNLAKTHSLMSELIQLVGNNTDIYIESALCRAAIPYYYAKGMYNEMYKYILPYEKMFQKVGSTTGLRDTYMWWFKADSALGNNKDAIAHYKLYKEATDSLLRISANREINQLQIEYETLKKDQALAANESNIILLNSQAKQTSLLMNLTILGIIAVTIIAGLLYRQSRLRKNNNNIITIKNEQLQHFLNEKEWLVKEIHHRVKNNLQIVMSLLNSQSAYIDNEPALTAIHDSQHRVHAMSLIHQKLYNTENVSSIDMSSYIRELASYLHDSFDTRQRIRFEFDIEPLELDVSQAVPIGLILNEAITNSLKYAFPNNKEGTINITLSNTSQNNYLLSISDNGIGMPTDIKKTGSLGMSLMKGLSEDLDGSFIMESNKGTTIKISFVHELTVKRPDIFTASF